MWHKTETTSVLTYYDIHVWRVWLNQPDGILHALRQTLTTSEITRAERYAFERHRRRFIVARGVLRALLASYVYCAPQQVIIACDTNGKPYLAPGVYGEEQNIFFNLSHSHELALYVFSYGRHVGIDVEHVRSVDYREHIVDRFFSPREKAVWLQLSPQEQQTGFFRCWTRKEAVLKAHGTGLAHHLNQVDVSFLPQEAPVIHSFNGYDVSRWRLDILQPASGYIGALVVEGSDWIKTCFEWDL